MAMLRDVVQKVRSKNAGPFWLTVDIFCGSSDAFQTVTNGLSGDRVAQVFGADPADINTYHIPSLNVVKFSLPRPTIQGSPEDRDMHGASWAALLSEVELNG